MLFIYDVLDSYTLTPLIESAGESRLRVCWSLRRFSFNVDLSFITTLLAGLILVFRCGLVRHRVLRVDVAHRYLYGLLYSRRQIFAHISQSESLSSDAMSRVSRICGLFRCHRRYRVLLHGVSLSRDK